MSIVFDEVRLPDNYSWGASGGPMFVTSINKALPRREQRIISWRNPLRKWNLKHSVKSLEELEVLREFFMDRQGRARAFRFKDWMDYKVRGQILSADGSDTSIGGGGHSSIPLYKLYTFDDGTQSFDVFPFGKRRLKKVVAESARFYSNDVEFGGGSIDETGGYLDISSPGGTITFDIDFDVPARFDSDSMPIRLNEWNNNEWPLGVEEVRL